MITPQQEQKLKDLVTIFVEENKKLNLSAMRDEESIWVGSILDSLAFIDYVESSSIFTFPASILDVGTGGGFPLLPVAICKPDSKVCGLDSTEKKLDAIMRMTDALELNNVSVLHGRTEELAHEEAHRDRYDIVTARALAPLNVLVEYCAPFVKKGGHLVAWKSMKIETELHESLLARAELSCHLVDTHEYELPGDWGKRQLLVFEKTSNTHKKYPRETGLPKKKPLI